MIATATWLMLTVMVFADKAQIATMPVPVPTLKACEDLRAAMQEKQREVAPKPGGPTAVHFFCVETDQRRDEII